MTDGDRIGPLDDADAALAVARACDERDAGVADTERRHITDDLEDPSVDVARDTWLARDVDGRPAAFASLVGPRPDLVQRSWVRVHPAFRGRGLGSTLLDLVVARARRRVPAGAPAPVLHTEVAAGDDDGLALVAARGFHEVRRLLHLERALGGGDLDAGPPPAGLLGRPIDHARDGAAVHALDVACFTGSFGYEPAPLDEWCRAHLDGADPISMLLTDGDAVVGFSIVLAGEPAWIEILAVDGPRRRRGAGTWLLRRAFADLAARGTEGVRLAVDASNAHGATGLYARVGFRERRAFVVLERSLSVGSSRGD